MLTGRPVTQAGDNILSRLSGFRVSPELGPPKVPGRQVDEVCGHSQVSLVIALNTPYSPASTS